MVSGFWEADLMREKMKHAGGKPFLLLLSLLVTALYIYSAKSFYNEYTWFNSIWSLVYYTLLLWICIFITAALLSIIGTRKIVGSIFSFSVFFLFYNCFLWGAPLFTNFILNWSKSDSAFFGIILSSVLFAFAVLVLIGKIFGKRLLKKSLCVVMAIIFVLSFAVTFLVISIKDEYYYKNKLEKAGSMDISFNPINSQQLLVTENEKNRCADWFKENILNAGKNGNAPAYNFRVNGVSLQNSFEDWDFSVGETSTKGVYYPEGKTTLITLTNKNLGLKATVTATIYETFATCEWTVYIKNISGENSGEITDFCALNSSFNLGNDTSLYYSTGSDCSADDFTLKKLKLSEVTTARFAATEGRSSVDYMPYFNFCGNTGLVLSVGWTGQWKATYQLTGDITHAKACQEHFQAYLTPDEEIRSPLVSICFYDGTNALKGFNLLRKWQMALSPNVSKPQVFYCYSNEQDYSTTTENIEAMLKLADFDALWIDAAWYKLTHRKWHNSVGSWSADAFNKNVFPDGIQAVGNFAREKGLGLLLWYEPERVTKGSELYSIGEQNPGWLLSGGDFLWNLANDDAFRYLCAYISTSIKDIGVTVYRQDFNTDALYYWNWGDKNLYDGRKGITENHYITNLYAYLDYLQNANIGLVIDNCASGGRRLDTEMTRRSVALHRSDYIKENEANQSITYGVSLWVPANGIILQLDDEYNARSWMTALNNVMTFNNENVETYKNFLTLHKKIYTNWFDNYFPLTPQNHNTQEWLAMQLGDGVDGFATIYKRENVKENEFTLVLNGLSEKKNYVLWDYDNSKKPLGTFTGKQLMSEGVVLTIKDTPKAMAVLYKVK